MIFLIHNIRKLVYLFSFSWAIFLYFLTSSSAGSYPLENIHLTRYYALTAVTFLYFALLASPLFAVFPKLVFKPVYIRARRSLGLSAFTFAFLHGNFAFFGQLGGFAGLPYLGNSYLVAITLSFTALLILSLMAATSWDWAVKALGYRWKLLHRFVYLAALLVLVHALMLGSHFADLSELVPKVFFLALAILLILESVRLDRYLSNKFNLTFSFGASTLLTIALVALSSYYLQAPGENSSTSLGIHAQHIQLAKQAQETSSNQLPSLPGLTGDRTRRYSVTVDHPKTISANQEVELTFKVFDASNGTQVKVFQKPYEKAFHLIIVDNSLEYFSHIHPDQVSSEFKIKTTFPTDSVYHLYADFQPLGAIDQQIASTIVVGNPETKSANLTPDKNLTKIFGDYKVSLESDGRLSAAAMSLGQQKLTFTVVDAKTNKPITDLKPYLGTFGHLVMIKSETYDYLHVHPYSLAAVPPNSSGGPKVEFLPIGIYGPFKPGVYRAFAQFNHGGQILLATFTVNVQD